MLRNIGKRYTEKDELCQECGIVVEKDQQMHLMEDHEESQESMWVCIDCVDKIYSKSN